MLAGSCVKHFQIFPFNGFIGFKAFSLFFIFCAIPHLSQFDGHLKRNFRRIGWCGSTSFRRFRYEKCKLKKIFEFTKNRVTKLYLIAYSPPLKSGGWYFGQHQFFLSLKQSSIRFGDRQKFSRGTIQEKAKTMNVKNVAYILKME